MGQFEKKEEELKESGQDQTDSRMDYAQEMRARVEAIERQVTEKRSTEDEERREEVKAEQEVGITRNLVETQGAKREIMSIRYLYRCNDCGHRWRDVDLRYGLVRCVMCDSENIEKIGEKRFLGSILIMCSIMSILIGSVMIFIYFEYLSTFPFVLWWVIPAGFYIGFFIPFSWFWFGDWERFLSLKNRGWIVLIIAVISSITIGSVLSVLYFGDLYIIDVGLWWVIPVGFGAGFIVPVIFYIIVETYHEWYHNL